MKQIIALALLSILFSAGCDSPADLSSDPVVNVGEDNQAMETAIATAKRTFPQFIEKWKPNVGNENFSVKIGIKTPDDSLEHIWFSPTEITATEFTGICGNDPAEVPGLKLGDKRTFPVDDVTDWMILEGPTCYGGYTIRVLAEMEPDMAPPFTFKDL